MLKRGSTVPEGRLTKDWGIGIVSAAIQEPLQPQKQGFEHKMYFAGTWKTNFVTKWLQNRPPELKIPKRTAK
jgi:hypothetical protein